MQFVFGVVIGFWLVAGVVVFAPAPIYDSGKKALTECEAYLPRNQVCEIYAKPKENK